MRAFIIIKNKIWANLCGNNGENLQNLCNGLKLKFNQILAMVIQFS